MLASFSRHWRRVGVVTIGLVVAVALVAPPAGAHFQASISHIWHHIQGKADKRYLRYEANVPPGKTLTGTWEASVIATGINNAAEDAISFTLPLRQAPTVKVVPTVGPVPAGCSGTLTQPDAAPGNLCIFVGWNTNTTTPGNIAGTYKAEIGGEGATRNGTVVYVKAAGAGLVEAGGSYAVTAPLSGTPRPIVSTSSKKGAGS